jgi:hypothetical protein
MKFTVLLRQKHSTKHPVPTLYGTPTAHPTYLTYTVTYAKQVGSLKRKQQKARQNIWRAKSGIAPL